LTRRIAFIIPSLDRAGAERQLALLASHLPRDQFASHVITLTRGGPYEADLQTAGVPVTHVGKRGKLDWAAYGRLRSALKEIQPSLVHTWLFAANCYGRWAAHRLGIHPLIASERCVDQWKSFRHLWIDRFLARLTDAIVVNSPGVRDFYIGQGIDPAKFVVIPNAVIPAADPPGTIGREEACRRLGVPPHSRIIMAVGRLWPQKRHKDLIWVGQTLARAIDHVVLVIIGDGPQRDTLRRHRDGIADPSRVLLVGERTDVPQLLPHAELFWNASSFEGQSNAILEAMAAGVPVVATDIPGTRDLVVHEQTGFLFPVGDVGMLSKFSHRLLTDANLRREMGERARGRVETEFTLEQMVGKHVELYQRLLGGVIGD